MELTVEGATVFATTGGRDPNPDLPLLLFIHGAALDHTTWQLQTRYFSHHGYSVMAVDLPQHGRSGGMALPTIEDNADCIADVIVAAGFERAHVVGHSMGARIALEVAARHPGRVRTVSLCAPAASLPVHPDLLAAAEKNDHLAFELMTSWGHGRVSHLGGHRTPGVWMVGSTMRLWERSAPGVLATTLKACNTYTHGAEAATTVQCPALLITGAIDIMTPPAAAQPLREGIADVKEVVVDRAGHIMLIERPDAVINAIAGFLARQG